MTKLRYGWALILLVALSGCASERHFAGDTLWPFGDPNAPDVHSETASRALGQSPAVTPIAPQAGNVWPGPVQPVPTIADIEKNMSTPLGQAYAPSLPSPYPPGQGPPPDQDSQDQSDYPAPAAAVPQIAPPPPAAAPTLPTQTEPDKAVPGETLPGQAVPLVSAPENPHARE